MRLLFRIATVAAASLTAGAPLALAQAVNDYVFNVPVNISALGPGHRADVVCKTLLDSGQKAGPRIVSQQTSAVPLDANGNYSGTVSVRVPYGAAPSPVTGLPIAANRYECLLRLDSGTSTPPSKSATWTSRGNL
ncbi:MAG TPA: hypothetical protein VEU32_20855 [Burkholderiales bacterium]|nr:hypothetical protein [Burkholderiales bacterium]